MTTLDFGRTREREVEVGVYPPINAPSARPTWSSEEKKKRHQDLDTTDTDCFVQNVGRLPVFLKERVTSYEKAI